MRLRSDIKRDREKITDIYYASASASHGIFEARNWMFGWSDVRTIWNFRNFHLKFIQTEVVGAFMFTVYTGTQIHIHTSHYITLHSGIHTYPFIYVHTQTNGSV